MANDAPPAGQTADTEDGAKEVRPRRGRKPGTTNKPSKTAIQGAVASALVTSNALILIASRFGITREDDVLNTDEIEALTEGITAEAMQSPKIAKWVTATSSASAHFALANALVMIAIPRLARRGIIPSFIAPESPVPVEAGGAYVGGGGYGERQVNPAFEVAS